MSIKFHYFFYIFLFFFSTVENPYKSSHVDLKLILPGMYAFIYEEHAAIILAVQWDSTGNVTKIRLAESNYVSPLEWHNPNGQIPFSRTVTTTRVVSMSGFYAVATEDLWLEERDRGIKAWIEESQEN